MCVNVCVCVNVSVCVCVGVQEQPERHQRLEALASRPIWCVCARACARVLFVRQPLSLTPSVARCVSLYTHAQLHIPRCPALFSLPTHAQLHYRQYAVLTSGIRGGLEAYLSGVAKQSKP
jgi:hypothetical protein